MTLQINNIIYVGRTWFAHFVKRDIIKSDLLTWVLQSKIFTNVRFFVMVMKRVSLVKNHPGRWW
jgi:hypothetical protein